jgi:thiol-disulfide isomerase/thioredoxin
MASKHSTWILSALAGALLFVAPGGAGADTRDVANAIRRHPLSDLDGKPLSWNRVEGQVVVVGFWASWCKPCRHEMPKLAALNEKLAPKGGRVIAISIDHDPENARRFAKKLGLTLPIYADGPDGLARTLDLKQIPYTVVLDRDGRVAYTATGSGEAEMDRLSATASRLAGLPVAASAQLEGSR